LPHDSPDLAASSFHVVLQLPDGRATTTTDDDYDDDDELDDAAPST
jgi:hypothetical protein